MIRLSSTRFRLQIYTYKLTCVCTSLRSNLILCVCTFYIKWVYMYRTGPIGILLLGGVGTRDSISTHIVRCITPKTSTLSFFLLLPASRTFLRYDHNRVFARTPTRYDIVIIYDFYIHFNFFFFS